MSTSQAIRQARRKKWARTAGDPFLRTCPWRITCVFQPLEAVLHRIEADGEIEAVRGQPVFHVPHAREWFDVAAAIQGVIEFAELARVRHGIAASVGGLRKLANKLDSGSPLFPADIEAARGDIDFCQRAWQGLRVSQADKLIEEVNSYEV